MAEPRNYLTAVLSEPIRDLNGLRLPRRIESWVETFDMEKGSGFIRHLPRNGIFFHRSDVIPDVVGRQFLKPQTIVSFELTESRGRFRAFNVKNESPELADIDLETYMETSYVHTWNKKPPNEMGESSFGFLIRPSGDQVFFKERNIITEGREILRSWDGVSEPIWVTHKIGVKFKDGKRQFRAIDVQILQPNEQPLDEIFLNAEELLLDVPESKQIVEPQSELLKPEKRTKTLLELIHERKK
jgi:cold shock CspA family protein